MSLNLNVDDFLRDPLVEKKAWLSLPSHIHKKDFGDAIAALAQNKWPMRVAYLDDDATFIANLRVWENLVLPLWRREGGRLARYEQDVVALFDLIEMPQEARERLVKQLPAMLSLSERRLLLLMRAILLMPECVIIEEMLWRELSSAGAESAHAKLFARVLSSPCVLVVASSAAPDDYLQIGLKL